MNANKENQGEDNPMEVKGDKVSEVDLGVLEKDLLEYDFIEAQDGGADETPMLMTPSPFMSPTKEPTASLYPGEPMSLMEAHQRRDTSRLLCESPRRRRIDESMRVAFLNTLPEEEWERYQSWRSVGVAFMESSWDVIRGYGTQFAMRVGLNQPIMCEELGKMMEPSESDGLTESVTKERAEESPVGRD